MIIKNEILINLINKYYLSGNINCVNWNIANNNITIRFISKSKDLVGEISLIHDFDYEKNIGIYDTTQLLKLIKIFKNDTINININGGDLNIYNDNYEVIYKLADSSLIPKTPSITLPNNFDIEFEINEVDNKHIINASNTLKEDNVAFTLEQSIDDKNLCKITFGQSNQYSNKISYSIKSKINIPYDLTYKVEFNSELFTNILLSNIDSTIYVKINKEGLMYIESNNNLFNSKYYLLKKSEI